MQAKSRMLACTPKLFLIIRDPRDHCTPAAQPWRWCLTLERGGHTAWMKWHDRK